jgi:iturin family lipopeptide synthetase A
MIPLHFVQLQAIPLTSNGKVDRKQLPSPQEQHNQSNQYLAPRNEIEEKLVKIWEEVLGKKQIGVQTSFFNLGGNSLDIIKMQRMVNEEFDVNFSIDKFFEYLTISDMIQAMEQEKTSQGEKLAEKEIETLTF